MLLCCSLWRGFSRGNRDDAEANHVQTYAAFQRDTGLDFLEQERLLASFAQHAEARGERCVRVEICLD